jgi:hypothetical protein
MISPTGSGPRPDDPSGLLSRVPELEALCFEAGIRKAIESGSPRKVYRAIFWARWLGRLNRGNLAHEADALLGNRRLFLEPLNGSAPTMSTVNGVGTMIYGRDEAGPDGAYITTLFIVFLFFPVIPLGAYLVQDAGGRSYRFFGKVPLGGLSYAWGMLLLVGAMGAALFGIGSALWSSQHATLYVVSGLPMPVVANVGGTQLSIGPESQASIVLGTGQHDIVITTTDGRELERGSLAARAGEDVLAWNVLGAAPLYREDVVYGPSAFGPPQGPEPELACGRTDVHWGSVDYPFVEPPASIQMSSSYGTETRTHAAVAPGGLRLCAAVLASRGDERGAVELVLHTARAIPATDVPNVLALVELARRIGATSDDILPILDATRNASPADVNAHRLYQEEMIALGRRDEVRADYQARAAADPSSADLAYLAARTEAGSAVESFAALAERFPEHAFTLRAYGYALYDVHRCEEALEVWGRPAAQGPGAEAMVAPRCECLVSLGRAGDALSLLSSTVAQTPEIAPLFATPYAQVARAANDPDPGRLVDGLDFTDDPGGRLRARLDAGLTINETELTRLEGVDRDLTELEAVGARDPMRAISLAASLPTHALGELPAGLYALVYAEACRRDPASAACTSIEAGASFGAARARAIRAFVETGTRTPELDDLPLPIRAAAWVVRSRGPVTPDEYTQLVAAVRLDDPLGGWPTRALSGWPSMESPPTP